MLIILLIIFTGLTALLIITVNQKECYDPTMFHLQVEDNLFIITDQGKLVGVIERNGSIDSLIIDYLQ